VYWINVAQNRGNSGILMWHRIEEIAGINVAQNRGSSGILMWHIIGEIAGS